jgi:predicted dehydrogenase
MNTIRVGIVGLGANCRLRHVPGLRRCPGVEIVAVCNRSAASTAAAAREFGIPRTWERWEQLVADPDIDAVVIGTWPYLHAPITVAALEAGKHVLTEARMANTAAEARRMLQASLARPDLVAQLVPSPFGLEIHRVVVEYLAAGFLGQLREAVVLGTNASLSDPATPLHWRQSAEFSGVNMLALGILHETLTRWTADPVRVMAQTAVFTRQRPEPRDVGAGTAELVDVETPDSVQVLTELPGGARGIYHLSGVIHHGPPPQIHLYGSAGTLRCEFAPRERLLAAAADEPHLREIPIPADKRGGWRVEEEFIAAIRGTGRIQFTDFAAGVRYMDFTEAVARSASNGRTVE